MNRVWLDISNRIDPLQTEALGELDRLATELGLIVRHALAREQKTAGKAMQESAWAFHSGDRISTGRT